MPNLIAANISKKMTVARDAFLLDLVLPADFQFTAGQFLIVDYGRNTDGDVVRRSYSLAASPNVLPATKLIVKVSPENSKSLPFLRRLQAGETVQVDGPHGFFRYEPHPNRRKVFLAAGTGIAPLKAMIDEWGEEEDGSRATLLYSAVDADHLFLHDELVKLARENPNFQAHFSVDRTEGSPHPAGRVTDHLELIEPDPANDDIYLCGPPAMVAATEELLFGFGFEAEQIKKERFN